jgi:hypothetical protein
MILSGFPLYEYFIQEFGKKNQYSVSGIQCSVPIRFAFGISAAPQYFVRPITDYRLPTHRSPITTHLSSLISHLSSPISHLSSLIAHLSSLLPITDHRSPLNQKHHFLLYPDSDVRPLQRLIFQQNRPI